MLRGVLRGGACRPAGQAVRDMCPQGNQRVTWGPKPVPEEGKLLPAWVSQEDFLEEGAAGLAGTTGQPPLCSNYLPARVFDSSDSIGATRSTAQQPTPGPPNILWERPGLRAALRRGWAGPAAPAVLSLPTWPTQGRPRAPCRGKLPVVKAGAAPGHVVSPGTACPGPSPTMTFALHSAQLRPLPEVCPPSRTLAANSAPSEARPRKG